MCLCVRKMSKLSLTSVPSTRLRFVRTYTLLAGAKGAHDDPDDEYKRILERWVLLFSVPCPVNFRGRREKTDNFVYDKERKGHKGDRVVYTHCTHAHTSTLVHTAHPHTSMHPDTNGRIHGFTRTRANENAHKRGRYDKTMVAAPGGLIECRR